MKEQTEKECPDCRYLREERAAIHEFDGGATRENAEKMAAEVRCGQHQQKELFK
jgi:hypothetical protein